MRLLSTEPDFRVVPIYRDRGLSSMSEVRLFARIYQRARVLKANFSVRTKNDHAQLCDPLLPQSGLDVLQLADLIFVTRGAFVRSGSTFGGASGLTAQARRRGCGRWRSPARCPVPGAPLVGGRGRGRAPLGAPGTAPQPRQVRVQVRAFSGSTAAVATPRCRSPALAAPGLAFAGARVTARVRRRRRRVLPKPRKPG